MVSDIHLTNAIKKLRHKLENFMGYSAIHKYNLNTNLHFYNNQCGSQHKDRQIDRQTDRQTETF